MIVSKSMAQKRRAKKNANLHPPETWSPNPVPSPPPEITLGLGKVATKRSCSFHQNNKLHYGMNPFLRFGSIPDCTFSKLLNLCLVPVKLSKQMQEEATSSVQKTPRNLENDTKTPDLTTNPMAWYPCRQLPLLLCTTQSSKMDGLELGASTRCIMFFHCVVPSRLSYQIRSIASNCFISTPNFHFRSTPKKEKKQLLAWKHLEVHHDVGLWPQKSGCHGWSMLAAMVTWTKSRGYSDILI